MRPTLTFLHRQQRQNLKTCSSGGGLYSALVKTNPSLSDFFVILMVLAHSNCLLLSQKKIKANSGCKLNSWGYGRPKMMVHLGSLVNSNFRILHSFICHDAFKMTQIMNKHWCSNFYKIVKTVYYQHLTCQIHSTGKTIFVLRGLRLMASGPFKHLQLDFIQLPFIVGY